MEQISPTKENFLLFRGFSRQLRNRDSIVIHFYTPVSHCRAKSFLHLYTVQAESSKAGEREREREREKKETKQENRFTLEPCISTLSSICFSLSISAFSLSLSLSLSEFSFTFFSLSIFLFLRRVRVANF